MTINRNSWINLDFVYTFRGVTLHPFLNDHLPPPSFQTTIHLASETHPLRCWPLSILTHWPPLMQRHWSSLTSVCSQPPSSFSDFLPLILMHPHGATIHLFLTTQSHWRPPPILSKHLLLPIPSHWPPPVHPSLNANIHLSTIDLHPSQIIHIHSLPLTACRLLPSLYLTPTSNKI